MFFEILENDSFPARSGMASKRCTCVDFDSAGGGIFEKLRKDHLFDSFFAHLGAVRVVKSGVNHKEK